MKDRRHFMGQLAAIAALGFLPLRDAKAMVPAGRDLWDAMSRFPYVSDGRGPRIFYILFEPTCSYAREQYNLTRDLTSLCEFRWIPMATRMPKSAGSAAQLVQTRSPNDLKTVMEQGGRAFSNQSSLWHELMNSRPDVQILELEIYPLMRRYSSPSIGSPSTVLKTSNNRYRLVRGFWTMQNYNSFPA